MLVVGSSPRLGPRPESLMRLMCPWVVIFLNVESMVNFDLN